MLAALVLPWFHSAAHPSGMRARTIRTACTVLDAGTVQTFDEAAYTCATDRGPVLEVNGRGRSPAVGQHVLLRGRLEDFDSPRNPGEPDERELQAERGVDARLSGAQILADLPPAPSTPAIDLARLHAWALTKLRSQLAEPYASILAGELWGERGALPPELHAEFQETGTVHVLVTAGLHLGVVAMVVLALLRACTAPRAVTCLAGIFAVWGYAVFSGLHLPSLRAAIMISCGLAAYGLGAAAISWRTYLVAAAAVALLRPNAVTGASYLLSFSCVGAIVLTAGEILKLFEHWTLPERVKEALTLTIATQIGTWPLTASIFLLFSPYAVLANLCVVPLVGATMLLGAAQLALPATLLAVVAANLNSWILAWIVACVQTISTLPFASIPMTPPPAWTIAVYDAAIALCVFCWKRGARTAAFAALFIGITTALVPPVSLNHRLRITVLDVGQADGIVIQTPRGHTLLVDAGGKLERGGGLQSSAEQVGERTVVPFLRRAGVREIDAMILSHPHGDHVGGFAPVLRAFHVAEFADSGQRYGGYAYNDALQTARSERVPMVYPRAGTAWRTDDGLTLTFIGPSLPFITGSQNDINNNSVAFILQYKRFRMLFTGDAGAEAEQRFLNEGIDLHADVLKVGHHGSAYSSTPAFIAAVHPRYAIVSVGRHNMFGHPAPSTIETLQRSGARIYRTDQDGAVVITIGADGTHCSVLGTVLSDR